MAEQTSNPSAIKTGEGIFKDPKVWLEDYIPDKILFRDEQIDRLNFYLSSVLRKTGCTNVLVLGDYGTGKTATVSHVVAKVKAQAAAQGVRLGVYWTNASNYTSVRQSVTCNRIFAQWLKAEGHEVWNSMPIEELVDRMVKNTKETYDSTLFIIDEVDEYLAIPKNDFERFGYLVSRTFHNASAILITNKFWVGSYLQQEIDARVVDTFSRNTTTLGFSDYIEDELLQILKERAKMGLNEQSYTPELLKKVAYVSYHQGWKARGVISLTKKCAEMAEREGYDHIEPWMVETVARKKPEQEMENVISTLDPPMQNILHFVERRMAAGAGWVKEQEIFGWFQSKEKTLKLLSGTGKSTFFAALGKLLGMSVIEREIMGRGRARGVYGRVRIVPQYVDIVRTVLGDDDVDAKKQQIILDPETVKEVSDEYGANL